ncbi:DoxX family protein [Methylobacterium sp. PvR107]|uniref:DoxX family protein n=1 Tax=Methylobacterium sp. PvR107 TaxID=2806597 RepID=UPI001AE3530C|nr:DoxX family protein [Methylobacterium sp. PvR107]MBP1181605.1 putative oxidoreductase [Methylobacterium sp. PvR107]
MALSFRVVPPPVRDGLLLLARLLLAWIFLHEGFVLAANFDSALAAMAKLGVPAPLAAATILLQLGAGLAVASGWRTRAAALSLCLFCVATAVLFHAHFAARNEMLHFQKDLAIAGGLCGLSVAGAGRFSVDGLIRIWKASRAKMASNRDLYREFGDGRSR